jgi:hypothetical protein
VANSIGFTAGCVPLDNSNPVAVPVDERNDPHPRHERTARLGHDGRGVEVVVDDRDVDLSRADIDVAGAGLDEPHGKLLVGLGNPVANDPQPE